MSPEQAGGDREVDARSDVYSLGCVLYEMLTGEPPYSGSTPVAILAKKSTTEPPSPRLVRPAVPPELESAVMTALARAPADRYQDARAFAEALEPPGPALVARGPRRAPRRLAVIGAALVVIAVLAAAWFVRPRADPPGALTLAVLPLRNLGDTGQEYLAHGLTEELTYRLTAVGLTVRSRRSVMRYADSNEPPSSIASALGVDALVDGSVLPVDDRVRIIIELRDARTDSALWNGDYERELGDVLTMQSDVARTVAQEIGVTVTPKGAQRLSGADDVDPSAFHAYWQGLYHWHRRTTQDLFTAIDYFEQAIEIEPGYARALASLADAYFLLGGNAMAALPPAEALSRAREAADSAVSLDPELAEARTSLASVDTYEWRLDSAVRGFELALELDPHYGLAHFRYASALAAMGRTPEAVDRAIQGRDVDPLVPIIRAGVAWMLHLDRQFERAAEESRELLRQDDTFAIGHLRLGIAYGFLERYDEAIAALERGVEASGQNPYLEASLARMHALAGHEAEARRRLADLLEMRDAGASYVPAYSLATVYAALGEIGEALDWIEEAYEERSLDLTHIAVDPEVDPLRDEQRFQAVMERVTMER